MTIVSDTAATQRGTRDEVGLLKHTVGELRKELDQILLQAREELEFPHIFSSLVTSGIIIGGWKLLVWSKDWFWWALGKVCCCCGCCRRGRYDDII